MGAFINALREDSDLRELSVSASFDVAETDNIVSVVYDHERNDPGFAIYQRQVDGKWVDVSCAQAAAQVRSAAQGLIALGVQPGDRVAIFSATRFEWAVLDMAILSVGALTVPIYETSSSDQVQWVLQDSGAVVAFGETDAHAGIIADLADKFDIVLIDGEAGVEQINRRVMKTVDHLVLVSDTSAKGVGVANTIAHVAVDNRAVNFASMGLILNRVRNVDEVNDIRTRTALNIYGWILEDDLIHDFDFKGRSLTDMPETSLSLGAVAGVLEKLHLLS